jgi:hypothetical protein
LGIPPLARAKATQILLLAFAVRFGSAAIACVANASLPPYEPAARQQPDFARFHGFWNTLARYDAGWYVNIARYGYTTSEARPANIAFFPAYPLTMRGVGRILTGTRHFYRKWCGGGHRHKRDGSHELVRHLGYYRAGILLSWSCFGAALLLLHRLARLHLGEAEAWRALLYLCVFPFAFFFGEVYTESFFLLLSVASFYCFQTGRPLTGGLCAALASATRVNGILALPALALVGWPAARSTPHGRSRLCAGLLLAGTGLAAYSVFSYWFAGNAFAWAAMIERGWSYRPGGAPWSGHARLLERLLTLHHEAAAQPDLAYDLLNGSAALLMLCGIPFVALRFGLGYALFMLLNLWLPLSSGSLEGLGRYSAVLFPLFLWLGSQRSRALHLALPIAFVLFYALALALFTRGYALV